MTADPLSNLAAFETATATDQVFEALYSAVITLDLPPGSKVSEAEVAKRMGVSRQPVRDAFYRLSELGFLRIRPQRATTITRISENAVLDARFIRTALEVECIRTAIGLITEHDLDHLEDLYRRQVEAVAASERLQLQELDDTFHRSICEIAGHAYAWNVIRDQKVHMDRVRYLSLYLGAQKVLDDHRAILDCLHARDEQNAEKRLREHLSNIVPILDQLRKSHSEHFEPRS